LNSFRFEIVKRNSWISCGHSLQLAKAIETNENKEKNKEKNKRKKKRRRRRRRRRKRRRSKDVKEKPKLRAKGIGSARCRESIQKHPLALQGITLINGRSLIFFEATGRCRCSSKWPLKLMPRSCSSGSSA
jgi:hypothetical protein